METDGTVTDPATTQPPRAPCEAADACRIPQPRTDAATFAAHLVEGPDDPVGRAEHLRHCVPCAQVARELRTDSAVDPDLELRLLHAFREWRNA
jgi:hypothetical protein